MTGVGFGADRNGGKKPEKPKKGKAAASRENLGKTKTKKRGKTQRQRKVIEALKKGLSPTEAVRIAGYAPSVIDNPKIVLDSATVKTEIAKFQDDICIAFPNERLIAVLKEGLEAQQVIYATSEGAISDIKALPHQTERRRTVELISEMSGRLRRNGPATNVGLQVIVEHIGGNQNQIAAQAAALVVSPRSK